jgi:Spy/CpxP family protein refolding chaperone
MQNGDREGAMELRGQIVNKVASVLTADQKKVVEKYPAPRMGQGGGRGNRPGGPPSSK